MSGRVWCRRLGRDRRGVALRRFGWISWKCFERLVRGGGVQFYLDALCDLATDSVGELVSLAGEGGEDDEEHK